MDTPIHKRVPFYEIEPYECDQDVTECRTCEKMCRRSGYSSRGVGCWHYDASDWYEPLTGPEYHLHFHCIRHQKVKGCAKTKDVPCEIEYVTMTEPNDVFVGKIIAAIVDTRKKVYLDCYYSDPSFTYMTVILPKEEKV